MSKPFFITGDTHFYNNDRFYMIPEEIECNVIILGDASFNVYLNKKDIRNKKNIHDKFPHITFYCVRGNHEARPSTVDGVIIEYDEEVKGDIYIHPDFPYIKYFIDGNTYTISDKSCLVIGGAYSVDKYYRLMRHSPWFCDEQLTESERNLIKNNVKGKEFDFILTHTCPLEWQPVDLFLPDIDQSTVDHSMEEWLSEVKDSIDYKHWCFGHFHAERTYRDEKAQMMFQKIYGFPSLLPIWF